MLMHGNIPTEKKIAINGKNIQEIATLATAIVDRVVNDNDDILYAPKSGDGIVTFHQNVDSIIASKLKKKFN